MTSGTTAGAFGDMVLFTTAALVLAVELGSRLLNRVLRRRIRDWTDRLHEATAEGALLDAVHAVLTHPDGWELDR